MRTYQYSLAKTTTPGSRFTRMSLGDIPMNTLYKTYDMPLYMFVSDTYAGGLRVVNMNDVRSDCAGRTMSFIDYLAVIGLTTLPYLEGPLPAVNTKYAHYADAHYAGYKIHPEHPQGYQVGVSEDEKTWAKLTKDSVDYVRLYKTSLVTVNGFFHSTDADSTGLYVRDAFASLNASKQNSMGITNFSEVCELTFTSFTDATITPGDSGKLYDECFVQLTDDVSAKTPLFIVGGYLFDSHPAFRRVSENTFRIRFSMLDLHNRYYEMREFMDVASLGITFDIRLKDKTVVSEFTTNDYITKLLQMSQSFMVFMDSNEIFYEYVPLSYDGVAPWCETPLIPDKPVITENGRLLDYVWQYGWDEHYILHMQSHRRKRNMYNTHNESSQPISMQLDPNNPLPLAKPSFYHIGKDI